MVSSSTERVLGKALSSTSAFSGWHLRASLCGQIPVELTSPWPESLYAYRRIWPILGFPAIE
jgi:hypothetical protein